MSQICRETGHCQVYRGQAYIRDNSSNTPPVRKRPGTLEWPEDYIRINVYRRVTPCTTPIQTNNKIIIHGGKVHGSERLLRSEAIIESDNFARMGNLRIISAMARCVRRSSFFSFFSTPRFKSQSGFRGARLKRFYKKTDKKVNT